MSQLSKSTLKTKKGAASPRPGMVTNSIWDAIIGLGHKVAI
jgi:hypothetical protein